jgi:hypothetical protein
MRKKLLRATTVLAFVIALFSIIWAATVTPQPRNKKQEGAQAKPKTLREAAQERNVEVLAQSHSETEYEDLQALAKEVNVIVLGRINAIEPSFTESGQFIVTNYEIDVKRVFKDTTAKGAWRHLEGAAPPAPLTSPLRFIRAGGVVEVNGHRASLKVKGYNLLREKRSYIFFLNWSPNFKTYILTGGISGVVAVKGNRRIQPLASAEALRLKYGNGNDNLETFITDLLSKK